MTRFVVLLTRTVRLGKQARLTVASQQHRKNYDNGDKKSWSRFYATCGASVMAVAALNGHSYSSLQALKEEKSDSRTETKTGERVFSSKEVAQHSKPATGVWISYEGQVYDITDFLKHHPGGSHTIMMGAGGDVGPFWQTYTFHKTEEVQRLLAKYKIGVLAAEDQPNPSENDAHPSEGPFANDPKRNPLLIVHTKEPFNAETPPKLLISTPLTPNELFFVRNHLPVPEVDIKDYRLTICLGTDGDPDGQKILAEFTLDDLRRKFQAHTIESVIQCSGNRRSDLKRIKEIKGLGWGVGAMGNARWTGVKLTDLLTSIGFKPDQSIKHVQMEGLDCDMSGQVYAASISADVAFDPKRDVLLAYEMNGEPLSRDHGFPVRFIAPGITGARNVKWLSKIILSHEESTGHWQQNDYKSFSPNIDMFNLDYRQSVSIQEMPVQSAICDPADGEQLCINVNSSRDLKIPIRGFAYSGGGKMVVRVDVSIDGGQTWITANLLDVPKDAKGLQDYTNRNRTWSWTRWSVDVPVPQSIIANRRGEMEILCRAFDSAYNSQPERPETIWNVRGVVHNSWHKIKLNFCTDKL